MAYIKIDWPKDADPETVSMAKLFCKITNDPKWEPALKTISMISSSQRRMMASVDTQLTDLISNPKPMTKAMFGAIFEALREDAMHTLDVTETLMEQFEKMGVK